MRLRFWKRAGFVPLYIRQTTSELTGEHSCVMVRGLKSSGDDELEWLAEFAKGALRAVWILRSFFNIFYRFQKAIFITFVLQIPRIRQRYGTEHIGSSERWSEEVQSCHSTRYDRCFLVLKRSEAHCLLELGSSELSFLLTPFDVKRLESYANNMLDYHVILDLLPTIASLFFEKRLGEEVHLSAVQSSILLALGLQRKSFEDVEV